jgi:hypothetical protein
MEFCAAHGSRACKGTELGRYDSGIYFGIEAHSQFFSLCTGIFSFGAIDVDFAWKAFWRAVGTAGRGAKIRSCNAKKGHNTPTHLGRECTLKEAGSRRMFVCIWDSYKQVTGRDE